MRFALILVALTVLLTATTGSASLADKISALLRRHENKPIAVNNEIDQIAEIYLKSSRQAEKAVREWQSKLKGEVGKDQQALVAIYREAALKSLSDVERLRSSAEHLETGQANLASLDQAASRVEHLWADAHREAMKQTKDLQRHVNEDWDTFRKRVATVWQEAQQQADREIENLREAARTVAEQADIEVAGELSQGQGQQLQGEREGPATRAARSVKAGAEQLAHSVSEGYEHMRDDVADIYHRAVQAAEEKIRELKHGASDTVAETREKITGVFRDTLAKAKAQAQALSRKRPVQQASDQVSSWYQTALHQAEEKLSDLGELAGETWEKTKARVLGVYSSELGVVDRRMQQLREELNQAEARKQQLIQAQREAEGLQQEHGLSFEQLKQRIARLFNPQPQPQEGMMKRAWHRLRDGVSNLWNGHQQEAAQGVKQGAKEKLQSATRAWQGVVHTAQERIGAMKESAGWTLAKLRDQIAGVFQALITKAKEGFAALQKKTQRSDEEAHELRLVEAYEKAGEKAKVRAEALEEVQGEAFGHARKRVVDIWVEEFGKVEPGAWQRALHQAEEALQQGQGQGQHSHQHQEEPQQRGRQHAVTGVAKKAYTEALHTAEGLVEKMEIPEGPGWQQAVFDIAHTYVHQFEDRAEVTLEREVFQELARLNQSGEAVPQELQREGRRAVALFTAMQDTVEAVEALPQNKATKSHIAGMFRDALAQAGHESTWGQVLKAKLRKLFGMEAKHEDL